MKVLASLKPYYYYLVGEGIKKIEVRKSEPKAKDWDRDVLFYMSKDEKSFAKIPKELQEKYRKHFGKVGLEFVCDRIYGYVPLVFKGQEFYQNFMQSEEFATCLTQEDLKEYGKGKDLYGWHISDLKIYDKPKEITEFYAAVSLKDIKCKYKEQRFKTYNGKPYYRCNLQNCVCEFRRLARQTDCDGFKNTRERHKLTRPPQSWCYVEENENDR